MSRSREIAKAFGKTGVLAKASAGQSVGGTEAITNLASLGTGSAGDQKFVTANKSLYVYDGTEWDRINSGPDAMPDITTTAPAEHSLSASGSATSFTIAANDPDGFPITYAYDTNPTNQQQCTIAESNGTFTMTPSTSESNAGSFVLRTHATDGVHTSTNSTNVTLAFGLANCYGFRIAQTSSSYAHTVWHATILDASGAINQDAAFANEATITASSWGQSVREPVANTTGFFGKYLKDEALATFGIDLGSTYYSVYVSNSGNNVTRDITWTNPRTITGIIISGDMTNGYDYFTGGYAQAYIGSNTNLVSTQYTFIGPSNNGFTAASSSKYYDFRG
tara:strand:- start:1653 stop:2660 length:1008 start_codon:yes stop_codon:yes gene_type:complete